MDGYQIRLEILRLAKELLDQQFGAERDKIMWNAEMNGQKVPVDSFPSYTVDDILKTATTLNQFVVTKSNGNRQLLQE